MKMQPKDSDISNAEFRSETIQNRYDEFTNQMDDILTEAMKRSNQIVMESEVAHLFTSQVFNASNDGIWAIDSNRKVIRINNKLLELYNKDVNDVIEHQCTDFFPEGCPLENDCPWESIKRRKPEVEEARTLVLPSGKRLIFRVDFTPLKNLEGKIIGMVETFNDITDIKKAEEDLKNANKRLEVLAKEDGLTKLANRRSFDEYLASEWRRQMRAGKPISLIMCDVDYFKKYNDCYGHLVGDHCLEAIAEVIRNSTHRASDMCARYGGEEFAVILPETDRDGALRVSKSIRYNLTAKRIPHKESDVDPYVTISCGIASMIPERDSRPEDLIEKADRMLYMAKEQGRNGVVVDERNPS